MKQVSECAATTMTGGARFFNGCFVSVLYSIVVPLKWMRDSSMQNEGVTYMTLKRKEANAPIYKSTVKIFHMHKAFHM